jgi:hypothetical protein
MSLNPLFCQKVGYIPSRLAKQAKQFLITAAISANTLAGALGAAAQCPERIGFAGQAANQTNHQKHKGQAIQGRWLEPGNLVN